MELLIGFECPHCRKIVFRQLDSFRPGEPRTCSACHSQGATLSDITLRDFAASLRQYCEQTSQH